MYIEKAIRYLPSPRAGEAELTLYPGLNRRMPLQSKTSQGKNLMTSNPETPLSSKHLSSLDLVNSPTQRAELGGRVCLPMRTISSFDGGQDRVL